MSEWWTYTLSDFLLFSPRTYDRLFELYNVDVWPLQIAMAGAGLAIVAMAWKPAWQRGAFVLLSLCWAWVAWAFHLERYAQINWTAPWFAGAFALQAALLAGTGAVVRAAPCVDTHSPSDRLRLVLALLVIVGYPLVAPVLGRPWTSGEAFGLAPDPTALATLCLVMRRHGPACWTLAIVPTAWCAVGAATLLAMESAQAYVVIVLALVALALPLARRRAAPRPR